MHLHEQSNYSANLYRLGFMAPAFIAHFTGIQQLLLFNSLSYLNLMVNVSFIKTFARYHLQVAVLSLNNRKFSHWLLEIPFEMGPAAKLIASWALSVPAATDVPLVRRTAASDGGSRPVRWLVRKRAQNFYRQRRRDGKPKWALWLGG